MNGSCSGLCCERFYLPASLEVLKRMAREGATANGSNLEIKMISEMVIPLDGGECVGFNPRRNTKLFSYTCKNWLDGKCSIYAKRPVVCRIHPTPGERCDESQPGCNLDPGGCSLQVGTDPVTARREFREANGLKPE